MIHLIKVFFRGKYLKYAIGGLLLLLSLTSLGVYISFKFLEWYKQFYDVLENKDYPGFKKSLIDFSVLAGASIILTTVLRYVNQLYTLEWREAITFDILDRWSGQEVEGYAQRIQEDCGKFSRIFESLFIGVFNAVLSVIIFTPLLLKLSKEVFPNSWGVLWLICLGYTLLGFIISIFVGSKLPKLEYENQRAEAAFRRSLEFKSSNYRTLFKIVKINFKNLFNKYKIFNLFSNTYFQVGVIVPYILVGKYYFLGIITLGTLVQVSQTFNKVNDSMSYLIDNWLSITELQSVVKRLSEFNNNLIEHDYNTHYKV